MEAEAEEDGPPDPRGPHSVCGGATHGCEAWSFIKDASRNLVSKCKKSVTRHTSQIQETEMCVTSNKDNGKKCQKRLILKLSI